MIELHNAVKTFKTRGRTVETLRSVSLSIGHGELVALVGESGAGKSTLLHLLGGLLLPTAGEYHFEGKPVPRGEDALARFRSRNIGFILQKNALLTDRTALYNIALPLRYRGVSRNEAERRATEVAQRLGIADMLNETPKTLSGGECQRVAVARAIVTDAKLILADEATASLDGKNKRIVVESLLELCGAGKTVVFATHDAEIERLCGRVFHMEKGRLWE